MKYLLQGIESNRLFFRILESSDFDAWLEFAGDEEGSAFVGLGHIPTPEGRCAQWFANSESRYRENRGGVNVMVEKSSGEMVGQCGLLVQEVDGIPELEIGYSIIPRFRNLGYALEGAQTCRDYAFQHDFASSLISIIHVDNHLSKKVALKNGMKLSHSTHFKGIPVDIYRITKEDWQQIRIDALF